MKIIIWLIFCILNHTMLHAFAFSFGNIIGNNRINTEWSSNENKGHDHLSAFIQEDDIVIYRTGTWYIDNIEVGDGTPATLQAGIVRAVQLVWSHDCEHGCIYIEPLIPTSSSNINTNTDDYDMLIKLDDDDNSVLAAFGPEQLVAVLAIDVIDDKYDLFRLKENWNKLIMKANL